jgi:ribosomal protein S27E
MFCNSEIFIYVSPYVCIMNVKCRRCGHEWNYKGKSLWYICCPTCMNKIRIGSGQPRKENKKEGE